MSTIYHGSPSAHQTETIEIRKDPARVNCYDNLDGSVSDGIVRRYRRDRL